MLTYTYNDIEKKEEEETQIQNNFIEKLNTFRNRRIVKSKFANSLLNFSK